MSKDKTKITLDYSFKEEDGAVVMMVKGTGIDLADDKHRKFVEILLNVVGTQMYAHAHNMDHRDITTSNMLPPSQSN